MKAKSNKETFDGLRDYISDEDKHFKQELPPNYTKFLSYLENRCLKEAGTSESESNESLTIEERKTLILMYLTNQQFDELIAKNFDYDTLIEVLWDLLNCLPSSLIPKQLFSIFMNASSTPSDSMELLTCLPKANSSLFKLIIKLLKASAKTAPIDYQRWVEAIFHIRSTAEISVESCISFLKLFV